MSVSANTEPWFGNQDTSQKHPLKNHRDKANYVLSFTPIRRVQIGKSIQIVEANDLVRIQVFTPHDYNRIVNPGKQGGGEGPNYFERSPSTKVTILHDPTLESKEEKVPADVKEPAKTEGKKTRRSSAEVEAERLAKLAEKSPVKTEAPEKPEGSEAPEIEDENLKEEGQDA